MMDRCLLALLLVSVIGATSPDALIASESPPTSEETPVTADSSETAASTTKTEDGPTLDIGGALRLNAFVKSWDEANRDRSGDLAFDTFRLNVDATTKGIDLSAEYRFYSGYNMLHHGYVGHTFANGDQVHLGVHQVPFGLLPYASHNWFFDLTYYLGMEDDYDAGVKAILSRGPFDIHLAFYKNDEGSFTGGSIDSARYSYDAVHTDQNELGYAGLSQPRTDEEINQFNGRIAHTFSHGEDSTEVGISVEYGGLYNAATSDTGDHWAFAAHMNGNYGHFNVMLEGLVYSFEPELGPTQDPRFIVLGAYDAPYKVAAEGSMLVANLSYKHPVTWKLADSLTFYNDFSYLKKREKSFSNSIQNVIGVLVSSGKLFTYIDFAFGKNHPWIGSDYGRALAEGQPDADWELRFNINIGYYF